MIICSMQIAQGEKTKPKQTAARAAAAVSLQHKNKFNRRGALGGYQDKVLLFCVESLACAAAEARPVRRRRV